MSFGKDNSQLGGIPKYGGSIAQKAANASRRKSQPTGKSKRAYWSDCFSPSEHQSSTIRLIPGSYTLKRIDTAGKEYEETCEWWECREHFHGTYRKGGLCSAGPRVMDRNARDTCYGCDIFWAGTKGNRKVSMSDKFVFDVLDQGMFHNVPQVDRKSGQYAMNPKTGTPYMEWVKCPVVGCHTCQTGVTEENSTVGHLQPWMLNKSHFKSLNGYAQSIGSCCVSCKGRGTIGTELWQCSNPACGEMIFDLKHTTATLEQISNVTSDLYRCPTCSNVDYPQEVISCKSCPNPVRATIFDVDMQVRVQKTGDGEQTVLIVEATSDPHPLDPKFEVKLKYAHKLDTRFVPTSLEDQAVAWHVNEQEPQQPQTRGYGQQR